MKLNVKILNITSIFCMVLGVVIAYIKFFFSLNWFDMLGDVNIQMLIGNILIFIGLIFRNLKKFGTWLHP